MEWVGLARLQLTLTANPHFVGGVSGDSRRDFHYHSVSQTFAEFDARVKLSERLRDRAGRNDCGDGKGLINWSAWLWDNEDRFMLHLRGSSPKAVSAQLRIMENTATAIDWSFMVCG